MNPVMFQVGGFEIRWYSIFILIGVLLAYEIMEFEAKKYNAPKDFVFNATFWSVLAGLFGARIYYVLFNISSYSHDIMSIFRFWEGGLAIHGGIIAGLITILLYCKKYNVRFSKMTDIIAPALIIAQAIGRWGNFFNSEAHGSATTLANLKSHLIIPDFVINGMNINGIYYEPTFYYESLWCVLGFIVLIILRSRSNTKLGTLSAVYLIWYGFGRFIIESMRTDSLMAGGLKMAQIVSVIMIIVGLIIIFMNSRKSTFDDKYSETDLSDVRF